MTTIKDSLYLDMTSYGMVRDTSALTVAQAQPFGTAVLLPEFELEEDILEWVEENASWLFELQLASWTEDEITGTGFPCVFYLKYDMYRNSWPLLALATYRQLLDKHVGSAQRRSHPTAR